MDTLNETSNPRRTRWEKGLISVFFWGVTTRSSSENPDFKTFASLGGSRPLQALYGILLQKLVTREELDFLNLEYVVI